SASSDRAGSAGAAGRREGIPALRGRGARAGRGDPPIPGSPRDPPAAADRLRSPESIHPFNPRNEQFECPLWIFSRLSMGGQARGGTTRDSCTEPTRARPIRPEVNSANQAAPSGPIAIPYGNPGPGKGQSAISPWALTLPMRSIDGSVNQTDPSP